jgi:hypothetical protein
MAVAFQSQSTVSLSARTNTTFTAPSGIANGDLLVIVMCLGDDPAQTATGPTGFTLMTGLPLDYTDATFSSYHVRIHAWYKAASGESGNYTVTHSSADTEGIMFRLSGQAATPINPAPGTTSHASSTGGGTVTAPTVTTEVDGSMLIWAGGTWDGFGNTSPPAGTTPTYTERMNSPTGIFYCATGVLDTAGATGAKSVTASQADNRAWGAVHIVIEAGESAASTQQPIGAYVRANVFMGGARA